MKHIRKKRYHVNCKYFGFIFFILSFTAFANLSSFSSLKIIPSAREQAMGGAGVIAAIGPQAMYHNPALTSELNAFAINFNYNKWFLDTYEQSIFLVRPLRALNLGFGMVGFNAGPLELRPNFPTDEILGEFNPVDFNFYFNLSRKIGTANDAFSLGVSGRLYYSKIYDETATGYGFDAGISYHPIPDLRVGFAIVNFGTQMRYISEKFSVPRRFATGADYLIKLNHNPNSPTLKLTSDLSYLYYEEKFNSNSGLEFILSDKYFVRAGYKLSGQPSHITAGIGFIVKNLRVEYVLTPNQFDLGSNHHISLSLGY